MGETKILRKVKNEKEESEKRTRRKEENSGGGVHSLRAPPPVAMCTTAALQCGYFKILSREAVSHELSTSWVQLIGELAWVG